MRKFIFVVFMLFLGAGPGITIDSYSRIPGEIENGSPGKPGRNKKSKKVKKPRSARRAIREQQAADRKLAREYVKFVKDSRERSFEIQTPEVKERMKKDKKEIVVRDNLKKKKNKKSNRKAGNKYN